MVVLIGYASEHGSTRGIAERLGVRFHEQGLRAAVHRMDDVEDCDSYGAVVLGSAIHNQAWLPEASGFVRRNAVALRALPLWLFSVGMPGALARPLRAWAMKEGPKVLAEFEQTIHPRDSRIFSGIVRPEQFPPVSRLIFRLMGGRYGDFRNWPEIDSWADGIARELSVRPDQMASG